MNEIMTKVPCVQIVPWNGESDFVTIRNDLSRDFCFGQHGNRGGEHFVNIHLTACADVNIMCIPYSKT